jgi:hypothetical protein
LARLSGSILLRATKKITNPIARSIRYGYLRGSVLAAFITENQVSFLAAPYWETIDKDIAALGWPREKNFTRERFSKIDLKKESAAASFLESENSEGVAVRTKELGDFLKQAQTDLAKRESDALLLGIFGAATREKLFERATGLIEEGTKNPDMLVAGYLVMRRLATDLGYKEEGENIKVLSQEAVNCKNAKQWQAAAEHLDQWMDHMLDLAENAPMQDSVIKQ